VTGHLDDLGLVLALRQHVDGVAGRVHDERQRHQGRGENQPEHQRHGRHRGDQALVHGANPLIRAKPTSGEFS
jgi:hypothetical protein